MSFLAPDWPAPGNVLAATSVRSNGAVEVPAAMAGFVYPRYRQVHGTVALPAASVATTTEADAVYTQEVGLICAVRTADCLPVLFCHREGSEVAAAHAGWRGLAAGALESTLDAMDSAPEDLLVWIGPAISARHYEVGNDVRAAFLAASPPAQLGAVSAAFVPRGDRFLADLVGIARMRLTAAGVSAIYGGSHCTYADAERFHSWRRDGEKAGRMVTAICRI